MFNTRTSVDDALQERVYKSFSIKANETYFIEMGGDLRTTPFQKIAFDSFGPLNAVDRSRQGSAGESGGGAGGVKSSGKKESLSLSHTEEGYEGKYDYEDRKGEKGEGSEKERRVTILVDGRRISEHLWYIYIICVRYM